MQKHAARALSHAHACMQGKTGVKKAWKDIGAVGQMLWSQGAKVEAEKQKAMGQ